jgi:hypothetical protein
LHRGVPNVVAGALIVPKGLLIKLTTGESIPSSLAKETRRVELIAMNAVMHREILLGNKPTDVSALKKGYDIESLTPEGNLRFLEVKGRAKGADTVTVTKNEVIVALNSPDSYYLVIVFVDGDEYSDPLYVGSPFTKEPEFSMTTLECKISTLVQR